MKYISTVVLLFVLIGCEKKVEFDLKETMPLLTVDASIESGQGPTVVLTKSLNYFSKVSAEVLANTIIKDAEVYLSTGNNTHQLRRYDVVLPGTTIPFSYYSSDTANASTIIRGEEGKSYQLRIVWQGKEYKSTTTIPAARKYIDSLWWVKAPNTPDTSTKVVVRARVIDPQPFGDYARYFTSVNNGTFLPGFNSVFDDAFVNGTTYTVDVDKGVDRNADLDFEEYGFFRKGDKVTVKFSSIDKATFDFWRTVEYSYQSIGNPFSTPTKIIGNIGNGALGYFGGYSSRYTTVNIPR
ncbi:DUF4249 domain-containing protein [Lacibacter luteus]|uniref:DUF4249 domain-containing protein n=1 Tax=Lacibacter luteus TaxID=2508719 RepID=A0A4V1M731_9BACT|nr:DUF4249 domain-containing protein [Lacibacter luteus]RXK58035.1 DUF4249 domain-containing protein [Lacibacter luteus]